MNKQTGINFIANAIAFAINFCISFFLTPFIIENIGVEANGFVTLANTFVDYATLFTIAINSMAGRFITIKIHQKNNLEASKYFTSVVFANIFFSVIVVVVFTFIILFLEKLLNISPASLNDIKILFIFVVLNFIITLFASTFSISAFATDRLDKSAFVNALGCILRAAVLVLCYSFFRPYTFYVGIATLIQGCNYLFNHMRYRRRLTPELLIRRNYYDFSCIKELLISGIWNSVSKLSTILSSGLDLLIANLFIGGIAMGVLNVSKTASNVIILLFGTLANIFVPQLTIAYANNKFAEMKKQLIFSVKILAVFSSIPAAILIGFGDAFYSLWVPSQDASLLHTLTAITFLGLAIALPFEPLYNVFTVSNKIKISSLALIIFSSASILATFIGLGFIHAENARLIYIVSVSALFTALRVISFLPIYSAKCLEFKVSTFYPVIARSVAAVIILTAISIALSCFIAINTWIGLIAVCIVIAVVGLFTGIASLFNKEEIHQLLGIIKQFAFKLRTK
ncbi:MAG: hypothetical protein E7420_05270 [Ruminococcaceae bacterium]|nr:hypothetical protein [Oscillospiraceae bacterium]